jgi:tetratricopeptide (TPR) repeat protein
MDDRAVPLSPASLHERLARVDSTLVSPDEIRKAGGQGVRHLQNDPALLLSATLVQACHNPVLGAAMGLGALEAARAQDERARLACAQAALGIALTWWGYYHEAQRLLEEAADYLRSDALERTHLYARWHLSLCRRRSRRIPGAFEDLLQIADRLDKVGDEPAAMRCRQDAVLHILPTQRCDEAIPVLHATGTYFAGQGSAGERGISLLRLAYVRFQHGQFEAGREKLEMAESAFESASMPAMLAAAWLYRGTYFAHHRQVAEAATWFEAAADRAAALQHKHLLVLSLLESAHLHFQQGDLAKSLETQRRAGQLAAELNWPYALADSELQVANLHLRQGRYEAAIGGYRRARERFEAIGYEVNGGICTMNLGIVARRQGHFSESLELLHQARQIFEAAGVYEHRANAHHNLGKTYAAFGYVEPAVEHFEACIAILEGAGATAQAARPAIYMAHLLLRLGETSRARQFLGRAIDQAAAAGMQMDVAAGERVLAGVMLREGRAADALTTYRSSLERLRTLGQEEAAWDAQLGMIEACLCLGEIDDAAGELQRLAAGKLPAASRWFYYDLSARVARSGGRQERALTAYLEALQHIRAARRSLMHEDEAAHFVFALQAVYDEAFALALELNNTSAAFDIAEWYGGQLVSVRLGRQGLSDAGPGALAGAVTELLCEQVGEAWTILRYVWHRGDLWLFALAPGDLARYHIRLDARATAALRLCASPDDSFRQFAYLGKAPLQNNAAAIARDGRQLLYSVLLPDPARRRFAPEHTLIIIPSRQLHGLPFQALLDDNQPLIEQTRIIYAPSLDVLKTSLSAAPAQPVMAGHGLILAQSEFSHPGYDNLPHVEDEVAAVALAGDAHVQRHMPGESRRGALIEGGTGGIFAGYDWLHIATHAYLEAETGFFTGLLLGPDVVRIQDICRWRLNARLVTLSACQTGLGRWHYGDEIAGLTQAFMGAGARTVISSLWVAADEPLMRLMTAFYSKLNKGASPTAALAEAQREAHRAGVEAYYWAPFSAFGRP